MKCAQAVGSSVVGIAEEEAGTTPVGANERRKQQEMPQPDRRRNQPGEPAQGMGVREGTTARGVE